MAIIFRELGSTGKYFRGAREQAHNFGDTGSLYNVSLTSKKPILLNNKGYK